MANNEINLGTKNELVNSSEKMLELIFQRNNFEISANVGEIPGEIISDAGENMVPRTRMAYFSNRLENKKKSFRSKYTWKNFNKRYLRIPTLDVFSLDLLAKKKQGWLR